MLFVKGSFKKSLSFFFFFGTPNVNGPHKFVEKTCFNEHLGEYSKWGLFFMQKMTKVYNKKTFCKKKENNATISNHKKLWHTMPLSQI